MATLRQLRRSVARRSGVAVTLKERYSAAKRGLLRIILSPGQEQRIAKETLNLLGLGEINESKAE